MAPSLSAEAPARRVRDIEYAAELLGLRLDVPWSIWDGYEAGVREPGILWRYDDEEPVPSEAGEEEEPGGVAEVTLRETDPGAIMEATEAEDAAAVVADAAAAARRADSNDMGRGGRGGPPQKMPLASGGPWALAREPTGAQPPRSCRARCGSLLPP